MRLPDPRESLRLTARCHDGAAGAAHVSGPGQSLTEPNATAGRGVRPISVTLVSGIGMIYGGLHTLCAPFALLRAFTGALPSSALLDACRGDPVLMQGIRVGMIVTVFLAIVLFIGSLGAMSLRPWARRLLVVYGGIAICLQ